MPFLQRFVEPKYLSRTSLQDENGDPLVTDCELDAVANNTLSNALRQLASLVLVANDIFTELTKELQKVSERSSTLKLRIGSVEDKLHGYDPKKVTVPEGDISSFALLRKHYERKMEVEPGLFNADSRPGALRALYEAAARTPVHVMRQMDRWRRDGHRSSRFFLCTPVLGAKRRKIRSRIDMDIETRMPAALGDLRRWTSSEAIGDITVTPDCVNRIPPNITVEDTDAIDTGAISGDDEGIDHKLPSPEEQLQVLALKFPAEIVAVDVSGRRFDRMSVQRRSLLHTDTAYDEENADGSTIRRRTRSRKPRGKRRNTLAGTDQKEIRDALIAGDEPTSTVVDEPESPETAPVARSKSTDILRSKKGSPPDGKKSHFNSLKQWGKSRLKLINRSSSESKAATTSAESPKAEDLDDVNIYETVTIRRRKSVDKETKPTHARKTSYSSSEKSSNISLPISTPLSAAMNIAVKLRESSTQRRQRRNKDEQHSSSGNWSASSESGRASIGSEITSTTHPKSTTSTATSNNSLNHGPPSSINSRRKFANTSTSSSVTSEGTLTPDIIHDIQDDGETSSVYSCDTEGYYTSFHMDSGLKTLKEEELGIPLTPLHTTSAFSSSSGNCTVLTAENEYELFGKGSTSTTTSSAGTVCTTLRAGDSNRSLIVGPAVPKRKSSLSTAERSTNSLEREFGSDKTGTVKRSPASSNKATVVAVVHKQEGGDVSPDSGHNTSSSPIESVSSPNGVPSSSEFEFSESSDLEGVERIERIRIKTTINSSRIPSMCVITPPHSDDESDCTQEENTHTKNNLNIPDLGSKNMNRSKLNLPLPDCQASEPDPNPPEATRVVVTPVNGTTKVQVISVNPASGYATVETVHADGTVKTGNLPKSVRAPSPSGGCLVVNEQPEKKPPSGQPIMKATLLPLNNMFGKLRTNLSNFTSRKVVAKPVTEMADMLDSGDYVTIADVRNNNEKAPMNSEVHYANDVVKRCLMAAPIGQTTRDNEYISLSELPVQGQESQGVNNGSSEQSSLERNRRQGARVTLDAEGKVVYSSDSLKRRKGAHTTFEPGPFVKDMSSPAGSPLPDHRAPKAIRPVASQDKSAVCPNPVPRPLSPQMSKVVIRANPKTSSGLTSPTADYVRMPPATIVTPTTRPMSPKLPGARGAYVHMQEDRGRSLSPAHEEERALSPFKSHQMHPQTADRYYHRDYAMDYHQIHKNDEFLQRNSPIYRTLPSRMTYPDNKYKATDATKGMTSQYHQGGDAYDTYDRDRYKFSSLPRRPFQKPEFTQLGIKNSEVFNMPQLGRSSDGIHRQEIPFESLQNKVPLSADGHYRTVQNFRNSTPEKGESNPFRIPMGVGHFFSPISKNKELQNEPFRISPIDPRNSGGFQSSTPSKPTAVNLSNKLLSPKKSTMSNEELYAMIHKSKKKLNIKTDGAGRNSPGNVSPGGSSVQSGRSTPVKQPESGYLGDARSRNSWSPNNDGFGALAIEPGSRQSWACSDRLGVKQTSRLDFKKLLLQHGSKSNVVTSTSNKLSAVEQLKLTKNQPVVKQPPPMNILDLSSSPRSLVNRKLSNISPTSPEKQRPPSKLLSPRSNWRFASPRSDVLSSTILEDCREDESSSSSIEKNSTKRSQEGRNVIQDSVTRSNASNVADDASPKFRSPSQLERSRNDLQGSGSDLQRGRSDLQRGRSDPQKSRSESGNELQKDRSELQRSRSELQKGRSELQRSGIDKTSEFQWNGRPNLSRAQILQAQRAEFFKTSSLRNSGNTSAFFPGEEKQKSPSPPTLETAL